MILTVVTLMISACAGTSEQPAVNQQANAQPWGSDEGDLVCRYERTIGSRIGSRVCRTQEEIRAEKEAGQEALEDWAFELDEDRIVTGN